MLFHITTRAAWDAAGDAGEYRADSLATEGFIHLSTDEQWPRTRERFFHGATGLVLLVLEESALTHVKYEAADGELFPHVYGVIPLTAVVEVRPLE